jgi:hypothetical protein
MFATTNILINTPPAPLLVYVVHIIYKNVANIGNTGRNQTTSEYKSAEGGKNTKGNHVRCKDSLASYIISQV